MLMHAHSYAINEAFKFMFVQAHYVSRLQRMACAGLQAEFDREGHSLCQVSLCRNCAAASESCDVLLDTTTCGCFRTFS